VKGVRTTASRRVIYDSQSSKSTQQEVGIWNNFRILFVHTAAHWNRRRNLRLRGLSNITSYYSQLKWVQALLHRGDRNRLKYEIKKSVLVCAAVKLYLLRINVIIIYLFSSSKNISYLMITSFSVGSRRIDVYLLYHNCLEKIGPFIECTKRKSIKKFNFFYHDILTLIIWILDTVIYLGNNNDNINRYVHYKNTGCLPSGFH